MEVMIFGFMTVDRYKNVVVLMDKQKVSSYKKVNQRLFVTFFQRNFCS